MKKILIVLLFAVACSKKGKTDQYCYYCTFENGAGGQAPPRTICIQAAENIDTMQFRDDKGNDLIQHCTKK